MPARPQTGPSDDRRTVVPVTRKALVEFVRDSDREPLRAEEVADRFLGLLTANPAWAKAFGHPLRAAIFRLLEQHGPMSPVQVAKHLGETGGLGRLAYHFRTLHQLGVIEEHRQIRRRGALEHVYRLADRT